MADLDPTAVSSAPRARALTTLDKQASTPLSRSLLSPSSAGRPRSSSTTSGGGYRPRSPSVRSVKETVVTYQTQGTNDSDSDSDESVFLLVLI